MVPSFKTRKLAQQDIRRLPESKFSSAKLTPLKLAGRGTGKTYVVRPEDAIDFVNALPPMRNEEYRGRMTSILQRWLEKGDDREGSPGIEASSAPFGPDGRIPNDESGSVEEERVPDMVDGEEEADRAGGAQAEEGPRAVGSMVLDQLFPGKSVTVYDGQCVGAVELAMVCTGNDSNHACEVIRRIPEESFNKRKLRLLKLPGPGNRRTYIVHFRDALELIMVLPGRMAMEIRRKFADILLRYFAGDASLGPEIDANATSDHPINRAARAALDEEQASAGEKRVRDLEETLRKADEACGSLEKRTKSMAGEMQRQREEAEGLAEVFKFAYEQVRGIRQEKEMILDLDDKIFGRNEQGRERLVVDLKKQDEVEALIAARKLRDEELSRAKSNEAIVTEAHAKIKAMNLLADAEARIEAAKQARAAPPAPPPPPPAQPAPPPPSQAPKEPYADVATFLPDDHTTVRKTYKDTYPRFKPSNLKDESKLLNEAQTRAREAYRSAHNGQCPRRVREERHIVDMFPTAWGGVVEALTTLQREAVGFGQQSMHSFVHVVHHNAPRTRFSRMPM